MCAGFFRNKQGLSLRSLYLQRRFLDNTEFEQKRDADITIFGQPHLCKKEESRPEHALFSCPFDGSQ